MYTASWDLGEAVFVGLVEAFQVATILPWLLRTLDVMPALLPTLSVFT